MINDIDAQILNILQQDARISNAEIARQVGLAPSAVLERIKKLEERGIIRGYETKLDAAELGFGLTAFVAVRTQDCCAENDRALTAIPEVLEVHDVAGEDSYLIKVRAQNGVELAKLLREKIRSIPNVTATKTTIVLQTLKETNALPVEPNAEEGQKAKGKSKNPRITIGEKGGL